MVNIVIPQPPRTPESQKRHNDDIYAFQKAGLGTVPNHTTKTRDITFSKDNINNAGRFIYNTDTKKMQYAVEEKNILKWKDLP